MKTPATPLLCLMIALLGLPWAAAQAQTTAFTYQGHLMDNGASANGNYDIQFTLKTALTAGSTVGTPQIVSPVNAVNGIFAVSLDFGSAPFDGSNRWVEMAVRPFGSAAAYTVLAPRQQLTSTPHAVRALNAGAAVTATNATNATNLTGTITAGNITAGTITGAMLANGTVGSTQLAAGSVTTTQLAAGTVAFADLAKPPQSGTVSGAGLALDFGRASFTVSFPLAFGSTPVVALSVVPGSSPFPSNAAVQVSTTSATQFSGRLDAQTSSPVIIETQVSPITGTSLAIVGSFPAVSYGSQLSGSLYYVRCLNANGNLWSTPLLVDSSVGSFGVDPSMAMVNSNPAIAYYDGIGDLLFVRATHPQGVSWGTPPVTVDSTNNTGENPSLAIVFGFPAIAYRYVTDGNLKFVRATDSSGTAWSTPITLDSTNDVGEFASLEVVSSNPAIAYYDATNGDLKYVRATNATGSAWGTPITVDDKDDVGRYASLAVVNGNPAIAYYDAGSGNLQYVRATNTSGSAWGTPISIDSTDDVGQHASLVVVNGNPAISYYDATNGNLKYVRATNASGTAWGAPVTLESTGDVGEFTSLAIANGNPAITYFDATDTSNTMLKFIRQVNPENSFNINWIALPP